METKMYFKKTLKKWKFLTKKTLKIKNQKTFQYDLPLADSSQTTTKHRPMFPKYYT